MFSLFLSNETCPYFQRTPLHASYYPACYYCNKRPMGHIAHLRKNTYDYILTLIKGRKKTFLLLWEFSVLHLKKLESPSPKDALCQVWLKLAQWFWRRKIFKFRHCIFIISKLSPLWKGRGPLFEQTWIPFTQRCFVQSLVEIG